MTTFYRKKSLTRKNVRKIISKFTKAHKRYSKRMNGGSTCSFTASPNICTKNEISILENKVPKEYGYFAVHPKLPIIATDDRAGDVNFWWMNSISGPTKPIDTVVSIKIKLDLMVRVDESFRNIFSITFHPSGNYLAIGYSIGGFNYLSIWHLNFDHKTDQSLDTIYTHDEMTVNVTVKTITQRTFGVRNSPETDYFSPPYLKCAYPIDKIFFDNPRSDGSKLFTLAIIYREPNPVIHIWKCDENNESNLYLFYTKLECNHKSKATSIVFTIKGTTNMMFSGHLDGSISAWVKLDDLRHGDMSVVEEKHHAATGVSINSIACLNSNLNDNIILATGSADNIVKIWSYSSYTLSCMFILTGHTGPVNTVAFHPDATKYIIASGSDDKTVKIWQLQPKFETISKDAIKPSIIECVATTGGLSDSIKMIAFHPISPILLVQQNSTRYKMNMLHFNISGWVSWFGAKLGLR
jgi:WD40 repeat protein